MRDPFASAKRSLSRGQYHISNLAERLNVITAAKAYVTFVVEPQPDGLTEILKLKFHPLFRDEFPSIVFDAVSNFRACLDQMIYAIAVPGGLPKHKFIPFPIGKDRDWAIKRINGLKHLPPEILAVFRSFHPYKGGNDTLWALNELCNIKKHAALIPIDPTGFSLALRPRPGTVSAQTRSVKISGPVRLSFGPFDAEANEIEVGPQPKGTYAETEAQVSYAVTLKHPEKVISGQHPIFLLDAIRAEVDGVLTDTISKCRELGLDLSHQ